MTTLAVLIDAAMSGGALRKRIANEESDAFDVLPFEMPARGPWCSDYSRQTGERAAQYHESLTQLGMALGDDGVMRLVAPPSATAGDPAGWKEWCDAVR